MPFFSDFNLVAPHSKLEQRDYVIGHELSGHWATCQARKLDAATGDILCGLNRAKEVMNSPTIDVLLAAGMEPTLDAWLEMNEAVGVYDAELLEVIPEEFGLRAEYEDRLRLNAEYEAKWEAQQLQELGSRVDQGGRIGLYSAHRGSPKCYARTGFSRSSGNHGSRRSRCSVICVLGLG